MISFNRVTFQRKNYGVNCICSGDNDLFYTNDIPTFKMKIQLRSTGNC